MFGKDLDDGAAKVLASVDGKVWGEILGPLLTQKPLLLREVTIPEKWMTRNLTRKMIISFGATAGVGSWLTEQKVNETLAWSVGVFVGAFCLAWLLDFFSPQQKKRR